MSATLREDPTTSHCCLRRKFATKTLSCNTQYFLFLILARGSTIHGERAVVFPLPQWLRERATMFYTYIHCLIFYKNILQTEKKTFIGKKRGVLRTDNVSGGTRWRRSACVINSNWEWLTVRLHRIGYCRWVPAWTQLHVQQFITAHSSVPLYCSSPLITIPYLKLIRSSSYWKPSSSLSTNLVAINVMG
jgi:hypothetical protein